MLDQRQALGGASVILVCWAAHRILTAGRREADLPPGPATVPVLGNLHVLPKSHSYIQFTEWSREFGEIYSLKKCSETIIVLSSPRAIYEVMERQGSALMDRPIKHIADLLCGSMFIGLARYGPNWRGARRVATEILKPQSCEKHLPIQLAESSQFMYDLHMNPADAHTHAERNSFSVVLSVMFGIRTPQSSASAIRTFFQSIHQMSALFEPGATPPLELFPIFKYVPARWAWWKDAVKETRALQRGFFFGLLKDVEERESAGLGNDCYMEWVRSQASQYDLTREQVGYVGGSMLNAGATTTASYFQFFMLLMMEHPEVQAKAREELDRVIGHDRMPTLDDMPSLPYVNAVIQEIHRLRPVAPLGVPHRAMEDVMYGNYRIPMGSMVLANIWGLLRDPTLFDDPETFNPDRYLSSPYGFKQNLPEIGPQDEECYKRFNIFVFGFGRRTCPGIHLATASISINIPRMLWGFEFVSAVKSDDDQPASSMNFNAGITNDPVRFKAIIRTRSPRHAEVIKQSFAESTPTFERFEVELDEQEKTFLKSQRSDLAHHL